MRHSSRRAPLAALACALALTACFGKRPIPDVKQTAQLPEAFAAPPQDAAPAAPQLSAWCSDFGQAELDDAVKMAFSKNLNLKSSWARLDQSQAILRQTRSSLYPSVTADASTGLSRQNFANVQPNPNVGQPPTVGFEPDVIGSHRISVGASYEVDLWGKLAAQRDAAAFDVAATRADIEVIAYSLTSSVAESWFDIIAQRQKRELIGQQILLNERYIELLKLRLQQGQGSALDINQQLQQLEQLRAQLHTLDLLEVQAAQRLAVLLGRAPSAGAALVPAALVQLPELPALPAQGVPADLLERRPDLRAAQARLEASNQRIAAAVRDRLPTLRLSASLFLQAQEVANLVDDIFWSATAAASQAIFDGGRRAAAVEGAEAAQRQTYYAYAHTLLTALQEVESALAGEHYQRQIIDKLSLQRDIAQTSLTLSRQNYSRGGLDFLRVLTSLQLMQQVEQSLIDAQRRQLSNRIQLCRALGGTWTRALKAPAANEEGVLYE